MGNKQSVVIYGKGDFYKKNSERLSSEYNVCGYVDKSLKTECSELSVWNSIKDVEVYYDAVVIMSERPQNIFEMLDSVKINEVSHEKVILGVSEFGYLSEYFVFWLMPNYSIKIICDNEEIIVNNSVEYARALRYLMEKTIYKNGGVLKESLKKLYEDQYKVLQLDKYVRCLDHDLDHYLRYEKEGYFGWGYAATIMMLAIDQFENPYILDLCCGSAYFYRRLFRHIEGVKYVGCDNDFGYYPQIYNKEFDENGIFVEADIVESLPQPTEKPHFDVVTWNGAFSCFYDEEHKTIVEAVADRLGENGIFAVTDYFNSEAPSTWYYSVNSANNEEKLRCLFEASFKNVYLYTGKKAGGFYLLASNGKLPINN